MIEISEIADKYVIVIESAAAIFLVGIACALALGVAWLGNLRQPAPERGDWDGEFDKNWKR